MNKKRCSWANHKNKLYQKYHDSEWGIPVHDDRKLFEMLTLEGAQAGLSWITVLKKRENYRKAFDDFNVQKIVKYDDNKINQLLQNEGIIRNRLKIKSTKQNAKVFIEIQKEFGTFDKYIWSFVDFKPMQNRFRTISEIPANTEISDNISKDLKKRGMNFAGSTIMYSFMQTIGMVNDHVIDCFRHGEIKNSYGTPL